MTDEEARLLDAEVAEKVMGLTLRHSSSGYGTASADSTGFRSESSCKFCGRVMSDQDLALWQERCVHAAPYFSRDIAVAMTVVEKLRERGFQVLIRSWEGAIDWGVKFTTYQARGREFEEDGNELPDVICRAALSAINSTVNK